MHIQLTSRRQFLTSCGALAAATWSLDAFGEGNRLAMKLADVPTDHVLTPAIRVATDSIRKAAGLTDYTARFVKTEMVKGIEKKGQMDIKLRHRPFSLYMKFLSPNKGRELIYVDGAYDGNLKVHESGFASLVGTLSLDPNGSMAMGESRYPVTMMGVRTLAEKVADQWATESVRMTPKVQYYPNATLGQEACKAIESSYSRPARGLLFQKTRLFISATSGLPIRLQQFAFNPTGGEPILVEDYAYLNLQPNVGLTNADFDISNPQYAY